MERITEKFMNWASVLEDSTRAQVQMTSEMPFIYPHIALMPDAHIGKGCAVGAVIPTIGAVMPATIGVDIGCGMIAIRTQFVSNDLPKDLKSLRKAIEKSVPLSAGHYNREVTSSRTQNRIDELEARAGFDVAAYGSNWRLQLGTLGSGNHFIEVNLDEENRVWLFLHSGSRGVGHKIATNHIKIARQFCSRSQINLPNPDLAYLVEGTPEFDRYLDELEWAQHFALLNREEMMDRVVNCFEGWIGDLISASERINCHHNYTQKETHFGKEVWLSRKGAIAAGSGVLGLIPGSMGTRSYVVEGKGNVLALNSAPHGAGRSYGRNQAKRAFTYDQLVKAMEGIEWSKSWAFLDEIPQAYKDIDVVMADSVDLVKVLHVLHQLVSVKGD